MTIDANMTPRNANNPDSTQSGGSLSVSLRERLYKKIANSIGHTMRSRLITLGRPGKSSEPLNRVIGNGDIPVISPIKTPF
jgi:hypothetical protein